jgi:hypothetical protein
MAGANLISSNRKFDRDFLLSPEKRITLDKLLPALPQQV